MSRRRFASLFVLAAACVSMPPPVPAQPGPAGLRPAGPPPPGATSPRGIVPLLPGGPAVPSGPVTTSHGFATFGALKYKAGFRHFDYVNPDAPKGGSYRMGLPGTFDTLSLISPLGMFPWNLGLMTDTLLKQSQDEPASFYCLLCTSVSWPKDLSWVEFTLDPRARFNDGRPITVEDVLFSYDLGKGISYPSFSRVVQLAPRVEQTGPNKVRFHFAMKHNVTGPTTIGQMPIMPKHYYKNRDPFRPSMEIAVGSGPYRIVEANSGRSVIFKRDPNYWAKDHPVNRGRWNFDIVRTDYYRDFNMLAEAFNVGLSEVRLESEGKDLERLKRMPAAIAGDIQRITLPYRNGGIYNSIVLNARTPFLSDRRVRKAVSLAFDYEWLQRVVLGGGYGRLGSNFPNTDFEARGLPSAAERRILEPFRASLPPEVFTTPPSLPLGGTQQRMRARLAEARDLLRAAGYRLVDGSLRDPRTGRPIELRLLAYSPLMAPRTALFIHNMAKLGVKVSFRHADASQMRQRTRNFDYDLMLPFGFLAPPPSAGMMVAGMWGSQSKGPPPMANYSGVKEPAIDAAIGAMMMATDRETTVAAVRAIDRVARWGYYSIPLQHAYPTPVGQIPISYWNKFGRPKVEATYDFPVTTGATWWYDPAKAARLSHGIHR